MHGAFLAQGGPPQSPQALPDVVWMEIWGWLQNTYWIVLALSIAALITFGAMLALDKERGQSVSASSPTVRGVEIALGVIIASSAVQIAAWFV